MSTAWTDEERRGIGGATELQVASWRPDGSLRPYVTLWGVRSGPDLYISSACGPQNGWFRRAAGTGGGRVRATTRRCGVKNHAWPAGMDIETPDQTRSSAS
jgi:hypothetical protein